MKNLFLTSAVFLIVSCGGEDISKNDNENIDIIENEYAGISISNEIVYDFNDLINRPTGYYYYDSETKNHPAGDIEYKNKGSGVVFNVSNGESATQTIYPFASASTVSNSIMVRYYINLAEWSDWREL